MRALALPLIALGLSGCLPQNQGLESQHKPIVEAGGAHVPGCPDWSSQGVDSAAGTDSNYGCATNANMAAMIANPADLVHGAAAAPGESSDVAVRAIKSWRTGTATTSSPAGASSSTTHGGPQ